MKKSTLIYDVIGIGAGPFNISVAALLQKSSVRGLFFEKQKKYSWHAGMQLPFATIQNSQTRDLVTLSDPTNPLSFLNFLHQNGRLEVHTIAGFKHIMRWEFEQYLQWAIEHLDNIYLGHCVKNITSTQEGFKVEVQNHNGTDYYLAKNLSIGTGVVPLIPDCVKNLIGKAIFHNSDYLFRSKEGVKSVVIVGGGQSALEVAIDLISNYKQVKNITLVFKESFTSQIEDSQFAEDLIFTTAGLNDFYHLDSFYKKEFISQYRLTSDGASPHTIQEFYQLLYKNCFLNNNEKKIEILNNNQLCSVVDCTKDSEHKFIVHCQSILDRSPTVVESDMIILATGYVQQFPSSLFSQQILENIEFDELNPKLDFNYKAMYSGQGSIFVLNGAKHTHGIVDPNLSLNAIRAYRVVDSILGSNNKMTVPTQVTFSRGA